MRRVLFTLAVVTIGGFAFAGASPAGAMPAGAVTGVSDGVQSSTDTVHWRRYHHRHRGWWWGHRRRHCIYRHGYRRCWY